MKKIYKNKALMLFALTLLITPLVFVQSGVATPDKGYFEPPIINTNYCQDFTITVYADVSYPIKMFEFYLNFNAAQMHVVNVVCLPPWMQTGLTVGSGYVWVQGTSSPPGFPVGPGKVALAAITFHCDASGSSQMWFSFFYVMKMDNNMVSLPTEGGTVNQYKLYWKPGGLIDYAPSGVPDFDQKQDAWVNPVTQQWSHCGPTAIANSFWWLDSFYEPNPKPPTIINDNFPLVWSYDSRWDDHDPRNVGPLIQDLAWYMNTNGQRYGVPYNGTRVSDMTRGIDQYLLDHGLADKFYQKTVKAPPFEYVEGELLKCEDVTLLLGFWQTSGTGIWWRVGGHYVTVAGIDSAGLLIAFSDPCIDNAEAGRPGIVLPGPHGYPHSSTLHNDTQFVSHDIYAAWVPGHGGSPGNPLFEVGYNAYEIAEWPLLISNMAGQNTPDEFAGLKGQYNPQLPVYTEVEYSVIVSPWYAKPPAIDYAPCGVPDFDQRQNSSAYNWKNPNPPIGTWSWCGPVAEANSLWYLDSYFEPKNIPPPTPSDNFPLVTAYGSWDDHDPRNLPPFVEDLAHYMDTNGISSGMPHCGTYVWDMQMGIERYLQDKGLDWKFYEHTVLSPSISLIDEELRKCQDVVLLLSFWQFMPYGDWERIGGHYVTVVGMDLTDMYMEISDPIQDKAELGGMGSVPVPHNHPKTEPPYTTHNNASLVSHDLYHVIYDPCLGGDWSLEGYWNESIHMNFIGQNIDATAPYNPQVLVHTQIEYAVIVSCKTGIVAAGSEDKNLYWWDFFGTPLWTWPLGNPVVSVAMDNDGRFTAAGTRSSTLPLTGSLTLIENSFFTQLWSKTLNVSTSYNGGYAGTESKSVDVKYNTYNGCVVVAAATDQGLYLYDQLGNLIFKYQDPLLKTPINIVRISQDGNYIICGYTGGTIYYFSHLADGVPGWSSADGNPRWKAALDGGYYWVAISGLGNYVAASRFWNSTHSAVDIYPGVPGPVWTSYVNLRYVRVDMPCNGRSLVAANDDPSDARGAQLVYWDDGGNGWDAGDTTPVWTYWPGKETGGGQNPLADFYTVAISENGDYIATGGAPRNTYLLDKTGAVQQVMGLMPGAIQSVDLTFTGKYGASVDNSGTIWFFNKDTGFLWSWANPSPSPFHCVAVSKIYPCMFPFPNHDVDIHNVSPRTGIIFQGFALNVTVTVSNEGNFAETANVKLWVQNSTNTSLVNETNIGTTAGTLTNITMQWNTTRFAKGNYTLFATVSIVYNEIDVYDNNFVNGKVTVSFPGDITGPAGVPDGVVDVDDAMFVCMRFGSYPGHDVGWGWHPVADITGPKGVPDNLIDVDDASFVALRFGLVDP